jgi:hypothetical protein
MNVDGISHQRGRSINNGCLVRRKLIANVEHPKCRSPSAHFWCKSAPKFAQDDSSIHIANFRDGKLLSRLFFFFADGEVREREFSITKAGEAQPVEPTGSRGLGARQWRRGDFVWSKSVTRRFDAPTLRSYNSYRSC